MATKPRPSTCVAHHWLLDEPNGLPTVAAECRWCGETREMRASYPEMEKHELSMRRYGGLGLTRQSLKEG